MPSGRSGGRRKSRLLKTNPPTPADRDQSMTILDETSTSNVSEPDASEDAASREETTGAPSAVRQIVAAALLTAVAIGSVLLLPPLVAGGILVTLAILYLARRLVFSWVGGLTLLVAVIMFIPVRRYA